MTIVNMGMLKHPVNWITIAIWVAILGWLLHASSFHLSAMYPPTSASDGVSK